MRALAVAWFGLIVAGIIGWIMNVVQVITIASEQGVVSTMFVLKCIGVLVAPLGAVLGWIG